MQLCGCCRIWLTCHESDCSDLHMGGKPLTVLIWHQVLGQKWLLIKITCFVAGMCVVKVAHEAESHHQSLLKRAATAIETGSVHSNRSAWVHVHTHSFHGGSSQGILVGQFYLTFHNACPCLMGQTPPNFFMGTLDLLRYQALNSYQNSWSSSYLNSTEQKGKNSRISVTAISDLIFILFSPYYSTLIHLIQIMGNTPMVNIFCQDQ